MPAGRTLVADDGRTKTYQHTDAGGNVIGSSQEAYGPEVDAAVTAAANDSTLRSRADAALVANDTFLAIASPSNAQTLAQVQRLTKECNALIRLVIRKLDSTAGTS